MSAYIDFACGEKCWNVIDSYGEICVHCGCCSKDKRTRYESRARTLENWIHYWENFDGWIDGWRDQQERNRRINLKIFKRQLRYYKHRLAEMEE